MNKIFFSLILLVTISSGFAQNNPELQKMADADQEERFSGEDWATVMKNDSIRLAKATQLFNDGELETAKDYYNAGIIFQHGKDTIASKMAVESFKTAIEMDSTLNRWWYAAAVDRDLMRRDVPQIYGTQYIGDGSGKQKQYKMDTTQVSDKERTYYRVPTLSQQKENERIMNLKKVFFYYTETNSIDKTIDLVKTEFKKGKESEYYIAESDLNNFGYHLMSQNKLEESLKVLKLNTELYPKAANTWDSCGEILLKLGKEKEAIKAYKKSLALDPNNENARNIIEEHK
ncbi:tetratricopeptide repeat protein [Zunongwangia sp. HGR-M22]|uniref:tetratricopeptide repeat protein n=1 Tax=Zunongwangia sp. HGR-M22 TaxID=3015168 RepID=UPI0022DD69A6|nr:tetratricopeptide repeat protein [Zunongwangia sp. HGR-M22]WBL25843.1 tetratricopeptide repeat protein [Zunongwangia sp. HGR-M22]